MGTVSLGCKHYGSQVRHGDGGTKDMYLSPGAGPVLLMLSTFTRVLWEKRRGTESCIPCPQACPFYIPLQKLPTLNQDPGQVL